MEIRRITNREQPTPEETRRLRRELRLLTVEMALRTLELVHESFLPRIKRLEAYDLMIIAGKVFELQMKRLPATVSVLARAMQSPRAMIHRRLARLKELGIVEQVGRRYAVTDEVLDRPSEVESYKRRMALIQETANRLSKLSLGLRGAHVVPPRNRNNKKPNWSSDNG